MTLKGQQTKWHWTKKQYEGDMEHVGDFRHCQANHCTLLQCSNELRRLM